MDSGVFLIGEVIEPYLLYVDFGGFSGIHILFGCLISILWGLFFVLRDFLCSDE